MCLDVDSHGCTAAETSARCIRDTCKRYSESGPDARAAGAFLAAANVIAASARITRRPVVIEIPLRREF